MVLIASSNTSTVKTHASLHEMPRQDFEVWPRHSLPTYIEQKMGMTKQYIFLHFMTTHARLKTLFVEGNK